MGLRRSSEYTGGMTRDHPPPFQCGDLTISPTLGQISNTAGATIRLGPVNMRVLEVLLARAGEVVSRSEIYEAVWKNQIVGEDALTRCISDISAELRAFSGRGDWIETLPKRGYRWRGETGATDLASHESNPSGAESKGPLAEQEHRTWFRQSPLRLAARGAGYLAALAAMAIVLVWGLDQFALARRPVVAILPIDAGAELTELAAEIDLELRAYLTSLDRIHLLAPSAIMSRPSNPFPFFAYEFGARWLIEADLRQLGPRTILTVTVADARTGIVEWQLDEKIQTAGAAGLTRPAALTDLGRFIDTELGR
jgi:DNA-binding winged helix-turn-helix (wHTH) protein